jgi:16S rRNA U516 pseudouridylate synthase RsuA-like enzyme
MKWMGFFSRLLTTTPRAAEDLKSSNGLISSKPSTRLSKHLSHVLKLCTRKEADEWIEAGKVLVNGKKAELGIKVKPGDSVLVYDSGEDVGKKYRVKDWTNKSAFALSAITKDFPGIELQQIPRLFIANKRSGQICDRTKDDNFFEQIKTEPNVPRNLILANGGLDVMASGLLLLTDNAALQRIMEKYPLNQVYYVRLNFDCYVS